MRCSEFFRKMFTSHSGISSKRVCGVIGWFVAVGVLIYCTIMTVQAPLMIDTFLLCVMALLGIDSVTGIWKKFRNDETKGRNHSNDRTLNQMLFIPRLPIPIFKLIYYE